MFLPNMTFLQPPGYVHQLYSSTWQPNGLGVVISKQSVNLSASAQQSDDGKTLVVRLANVGKGEVTLSMEVRGRHILGQATQWLLASPSRDRLDANTPSEPERVSPVKSTIDASAGITLPPVSVAVVVMMIL